MKNNSQTILGIGIDMVEILRIKKAVKSDKNFLKRFFSESEITYCLKAKNKYERIAVRFAAKEAIIKACGIKGVALKNISIEKEKTGKPFVKINDNKFKKFKCLISLSHTSKYACAAAVQVLGGGRKKRVSLKERKKSPNSSSSRR